MEAIKSTSLAMRPNTGKGKEICDVLRRELRIPERARWFEVRFAVGEVVTIKCEYLPEEEEEGRVE